MCSDCSQSQVLKHQCNAKTKFKEYQTNTRKGTPALSCCVVSSIRSERIGDSGSTLTLGVSKYYDIRQIGKPQRVQGDILKRLEIRQTRSKDLPIFLHSKNLIVPDVLLDGKLLAIDSAMPHYCINVMKKLMTLGHE